MMKYLKKYNLFESSVSLEGELQDIFLEVNDELYWSVRCWEQKDNYVVIIELVDEDFEYELEGLQPSAIVVDSISRAIDFMTSNGFESSITFETDNDNQFEEITLDEVSDLDVWPNNFIRVEFIKIKVLERYKFIEVLDLLSYEKELAHIENQFVDLPKQDLTEIAMDLEDIGVRFYTEILIASIWQGEELQQSRRKTSDGEWFTYYKTKDYYTGDKFFEKNSIKSVTSEMMNSIINVKPKNELDELFNNENIKRHFSNQIKKEAAIFSSKLKEGWMPCFVVSKMPIGKNWEMKQNLVDAFFELREKTLGLCNYEIVFLPTDEEPSIIFIDKKYIKS